VEAKSEVSDGSLLLLVAFQLVNAPNCHLSLVLASVQGDAVNCNNRLHRKPFHTTLFTHLNYFSCNIVNLQDNNGMCRNSLLGIIMACLGIAWSKLNLSWLGWNCTVVFAF